MKQYTREEIKNLVEKASKSVSTYNFEIPNTGNANEDAVEILCSAIAQVQRNCENIITEVLNKILND